MTKFGSFIVPIKKISSFRTIRGESWCKRGLNPEFELWVSEESEGEMEDEDGGLFNIEVGSDESVNKSEKVPRDFQSEEDFQKQRKGWKPRIEMGGASIPLLVDIVEIYSHLIRFGGASSYQSTTLPNQKARPSSMRLKSCISLGDMKTRGVSRMMF